MGLLVGGASAYAGGEGQLNGVVCAVITLAAIFGGKMLALDWSVGGEIDAIIAESLTEEFYEEIANDAADFANLESSSQYAEFMVTHGYTEAEHAADVTQEEIQAFEEHNVPDLIEFEREQPEYAHWRQQQKEDFTELVAQNFDSAEIAQSNLGAVDLLFGFFGIATAYRVGSSGRDSE